MVPLARFLSKVSAAPPRGAAEGAEFNHLTALRGECIDRLLEGRRARTEAARDGTQIETAASPDRPATFGQARQRLVNSRVAAQVEELLVASGVPFGKPATCARI
jgi:hypothetical protein